MLAALVIAVEDVDPLVVTNHQEHQATEQFAKLSHSRDREVAMRAVLQGDGDQEAAIRAFMAPPTYNTHFEHRFGTLYTAVMRPSARCVDYRWPSSLWRQSFDGFSEGDHTVLLRG